jgi:hypothetical protein
LENFYEAVEFYQDLFQFKDVDYNPSDVENIMLELIPGRMTYPFPSPKAKGSK